MRLPWPFDSSKSVVSSDTGTSSTRAALQDTTGVENIPPRHTLTREEQADFEFDKLVREFQNSNTVDEQSRTVAAQAVSATRPARPRQVYEAQTFEDGTIDIRPEVMHPRSMNCRQQFDQAFYCQSLGGKFNDLYRYGEFRSCSEQWSAFWFCMRTRTLDDETKAAETTTYYADRDAKRKKEHGSSEDIWELRTRSVQRAFWKDPDLAVKEEAVKE